MYQLFKLLTVSTIFLISLVWQWRIGLSGFSRNSSFIWSVMPTVVAPGWGLVFWSPCRNFIPSCVLHHRVTDYKDFFWVFFSVVFCKIICVACEFLNAWNFDLIPGVLYLVQELFLWFFAYLLFGCKYFYFVLRLIQSYILILLSRFVHHFVSVIHISNTLFSLYNVDLFLRLQSLNLTFRSETQFLNTLSWLMFQLPFHLVSSWDQYLRECRGSIMLCIDGWRLIVEGAFNLSLLFRTS